MDYIFLLNTDFDISYFREIGRELNRTVAKLEKLTERKELYVLYCVRVVARNLILFIIIIKIPLLLLLKPHYCVMTLLSVL